MIHKFFFPALLLFGLMAMSFFAGSHLAACTTSREIIFTGLGGTIIGGLIGYYSTIMGAKVQEDAAKKQRLEDELFENWVAEKSVLKICDLAEDLANVFSFQNSQNDARSPLTTFVWLT